MPGDKTSARIVLSGRSVMTNALKAISIRCIICNINVFQGYQKHETVYHCRMTLLETPAFICNVSDTHDTYMNRNFKHLLILFFRLCTVEVKSESEIENKVS